MIYVLFKFWGWMNKLFLYLCLVSCYVHINMCTFACLHFFYSYGVSMCIGDASLYDKVKTLQIEQIIFGECSADCLALGR